MTVTLDPPIDQTLNSTPVLQEENKVTNVAKDALPKEKLEKPTTIPPVTDLNKTLDPDYVKPPSTSGDEKKAAPQAAEKKTWTEYFFGKSAPVQKPPSKTYSAKSKSSSGEDAPVDDANDAADEPATPPPITADALWKKVVTLIPVVGIVPAFVCTASLSDYADNNPTLESRVWEIKRQYQGISIARSLLEIAIVAKIVALGILGFKLGIAIAAVPVILLAMHIYKCVEASLKCAPPAGAGDQQ